MPTPIQQKPTTNSRLSSTKPKSGGVLSRIAPVGSVERGMRLSVYGRPKTGKTRLSCSFPKPLLIIGTEDGTESVKGMKGVDFVLLERTSELAELVNGPLAEGKYKTAVLDNGTRFRDMRISEILNLDTVPVQKGWGFASRENWIECSNSMKLMLKPLFDLARKTPLNLVVIAQEQNFTDEDGQGGSELIAPSISSALGKSVCDWVNAECDYVCQTLIREQEREKETVTAGKKTKIKVKTGKKEYCLRIGPHSVYYAGIRLPNGKILDDGVEFIVNPSYDKIKALVDKALKE